MTLQPSSSTAGSLVLSLFPGADLLGRGFEAEGYCVVRGPDILWGQDVRDFTPTRHAAKGIIGGPPCQDFSKALRTEPTGQGVELIGEYCRCVMAVEPDWFLMENVPAVPSVREFFGHWLDDNGYTVQRFNINAREVGCRQNRLRCFQFGWRDGLGPVVIHRGTTHRGESHEPCAMASEGKRQHRRTWADFCELQGLPRDFALPGLSLAARYQAVGNGVPVRLARVIAGAINSRSVTLRRLCVCQCGREVPAGTTLATPACRKRMQRQRDVATVTAPGPVTIAQSLPGL